MTGFTSVLQANPICIPVRYVLTTVSFVIRKRIHSCTVPSAAGSWQAMALSAVRFSIFLKAVPVPRLEVIRHRYRCTNKECRYSYVYPISFQDPGHMVTQLLFDYVKQLLSYGLSYRQIALITGLNKNTISAINSQAV